MLNRDLMSHPGRSFLLMGIDLRNGTVRIDQFETADPAVVGLLTGVEHGAERERLVSDALSTGARGLMSMGLGVRVEDLEARLRSGAEAAAAETLGQLEAAVMRAAKSLEAGIDLGRSSSHSSVFLSELQALLGPGRRLLKGFGPTRSGGKFALARAFPAWRADFGPIPKRIRPRTGRFEKALRDRQGSDQFASRTFANRVHGHLEQGRRGTLSLHLEKLCSLWPNHQETRSFHRKDSIAAYRHHADTRGTKA